MSYFQESIKLKNINRKEQTSYKRLSHRLHIARMQMAADQGPYDA